MSYNENEEFELNFDDDVVDMTNPNRKNAHSEYSGTSDNYGDSPNNDDIYGVYNPNVVLQRELVKQANNDDSAIRIMNKLYYIAWLVEILFIAYFAFVKDFDIKGYGRIAGIVGLFFNGVFIVESVVLYQRYRRVSLIVTAVILPFLYPFFRSGTLGESKTIPAMLWLIVSILSFMLAKNIISPIDFSKVGEDKYASKYNTTMKKFKDCKYDDRVKTVRVLKVWFDSYSLDVKSEDEEYLYVELAGVTHTAVMGVVPDSKLNPNTILTFKVNKNSGSYTVTGLNINGDSYNAYAKDLWEYWYSNTNG